MDPSKENNKSWKKVAIFDNYSDASEKKLKLLAEESSDQLLVKIRRCGPGGSRVKVKVWHPDFVKPKKEKKNVRKTKKPKNSKPSTTS